mgnify:CR=1 FL=1
MEKISGWGRTAFSSANLISTEHPLPNLEFIPRGLGRSYGDASQLSGGNVYLGLGGKSCLINEANGTAKVGASLSIAEFISVSIPKGWFVPVTPGTK